MPRGFHSYKTQRWKYLNPSNVKEVEGQNIFTFTGAKLVCPRTHRVLETQCKKTGRQLLVGVDYIVFCRTPNTFPLKIN